MRSWRGIGALGFSLYLLINKLRLRPIRFNIVESVMYRRTGNSKISSQNLRTHKCELIEQILFIIQLYASAYLQAQKLWETITTQKYKYPNPKQISNRSHHKYLLSYDIDNVHEMIPVDQQEWIQTGIIKVTRNKTQLIQLKFMKERICPASALSS